MPALKDITGNKYNSLLVMERTENVNGRVAWKCLCDCGKTTVIRTGDLTPGYVKTCGKCDDVYHSVLYEFKKDHAIGHSKSGRTFIIDIDDVLRVKDFSISVFNKGYVSLISKGESIPLHRFLLNAPEDKVVDHINRNPSDNRKSNLRICSQAENMRNRTLSKVNKSGITGVYKVRNRWYAVIWFNKSIHLGTFENKEDAIEARKKLK